MPRFQGEHFYRNLELVEKIKSMAEEKGCTPAQLAIAWVLAQGEDIVTIPGSKRIRHLEENIASEKLALTKEDLKEIDLAMPVGSASGTRYAERFMNMLNN